MEQQVGTVVAGYRIEELIGRGGMGFVCRANHLHLHRKVALKLLAPKDPTGVAVGLESVWVTVDDE